MLKRALDQASGQVAAETCVKQQAEAEWGRLLSAIQARGSYRGQPEDLHETTAYVLRCMGGWDCAYQWKQDRLEWLRREFVSQWELCHEIMALGAGAGQNAGLKSAGDILSGILPQKPAQVELCS